MSSEAEIEAAFCRHEGHVGFEFSGGRDSTAALYLLRPWWGRMTVYFLDTTDHFPETLAVVDQVERDVPVVRIHSDVPADRAAHGIPSDVLPADNTLAGRMVAGDRTKLQGRYECCARSLMMPMHTRVLADGVTLIIRGQRDDEYATPPMRSGDRAEGLEVLYPVQAWTGAQVLAYIRENGLPLATFYDHGMKHGSDCMGCTAWWDEGRAAFMKAQYPREHAVLVQSLAEIRAQVTRQMAWLDVEAA